MDGASGSILFSGNPAAERRLAATLSKIDREKKKRESSMTWNQRNFFMKQIFDQDNNLRFVKASQRPKYLECIPPPPPDGDNSWESEEYVFSFKPRRNSSPLGRDRFGRRDSKESPRDEPQRDSEVDEVVAVAEAQEEEVEEIKTEEDLEREAKQAEQERLEKEKLDRSMGVFGRRREKLKMPVLMTGGIKRNPEEEKKLAEDKANEPNETETPTAETEKKDDNGQELVPDPLNQSNSSADGSQEGPSKPKTRFPVFESSSVRTLCNIVQEKRFLPTSSGSETTTTAATARVYPEPAVYSDEFTSCGRFGKYRCGTATNCAANNC